MLGILSTAAATRVAWTSQESVMSQYADLVELVGAKGRAVLTDAQAQSFAFVATAKQVAEKVTALATEVPAVEDVPTIAKNVVETNSRIVQDVLADQKAYLLKVINEWPSVPQAFTKVA